MDKVQKPINSTPLVEPFRIYMYNKCSAVYIPLNPPGGAEVAGAPDNPSCREVTFDVI
jgi:hypothetical protein